MTAHTRKDNQLIVTTVATYHNNRTIIMATTLVMYHDTITPTMTIIAVLYRDNKILTTITIDGSHVNIIPVTIIMVDKIEKLWAGTPSTITTNQIRP